MSTEPSAGRKFRDLIATGETILVPGAHDPLMGRILQRMGFKVVAVAGWMTAAHLTTAEPLLTMTEQVEVARRVANAVDIPVRADACTGYGDPIHIMRTVQEFERAGVAGIHIEDQVFPKRASYHRGLEHVVELDELLRRLEYALKARRDKDFMIFARTDAGNAVNGSWKEAARRARAVKALGVDGLLPMTRNKESIEHFRQEYPDNDLTLLVTTYFNGLHPTELRKYGFQLVIYPLVTIVSSAAEVVKMYRGVKETGIAAMDPEWAREVREEIEAAIGLPEFWKIEQETVEAMHKDYTGRTNPGYESYDQKKT
jgi:2-methylisocitrate lyase-like PEP mutase family enzyme